MNHCCRKFKQESEFNLNKVYHFISQDSLSDYSVSRAPPADTHDSLEAVNNTSIPGDEGRNTTHVSVSSNSSPPHDKVKLKG